MLNMRKKARKQRVQKRADDRISVTSDWADDRKCGTSDWAGLPEGLVDEISRRVPVVSSISMGDVCKSWRHVLKETCPLPTQKRGLPWLMLRGENDSEVRTCYSILEDRIWDLEVPEAVGSYCWGSIFEWLIVARMCCSDKIEIFFWNPFSRTKILLPDMWSCYSKIVISASPAEANCVFLLLGGWGAGIACWTPGVQTWREQQHLGFSVRDVVHCNGKFYFVTRDYDIYTVDANSMISSLKQCQDSRNDIKLQFHHHQVEMPDRPPITDVRQYLVESCGEVLLVCRFFEGSDPYVRVTRTFELFKLDAHRMIWMKMESLVDRVLFIGNSDSRSVSSKELGVDVNNCIFFFNDYANSWCTEWEQERTRNEYSLRPRNNEWGIFSLDGNSFVPSSCNRGFIATLPPIWITAPLWWYLSKISQ